MNSRKRASLDSNLIMVPRPRGLALTVRISFILALIVTTAASDRLSDIGYLSAPRALFNIFVT